MFARLFGKQSKAHPARVPETAVAPQAPAVPATSETPKAAQDRALIDALVESRQRFKQIVEVSGDFAWETNADGEFVYVSPGVTIGYRPDEMVGVPAARFVAEAGLGSRDTPFFARESVRDVDVWLRTASGRDACLRTSAAPVPVRGGEWRGARGVCRDVTAEVHRAATLAAMQMRESLMARIVAAAASETDPDRMLELALNETRATFAGEYAGIRTPQPDGGFAVAAGSDGAGPDEAPVMTSVFARLAETPSIVTAADGDRYYLCAPTQYHGRVTGALLVTRGLEGGAWTDEERAFAADVAAQFAILLEQIESHRQLEAMARTDEMTGLLNRRAFYADLADRLARISDGGAAGSLFYVDLDNFKAVNDVHGHKRGDEALIALAGLLVTKTRPGDLVARLGGDEFAMWLERTDAKAADGRAKNLLEASAGLRVFSGSPEKPLGISVGVAVYRPGCGETLSELTARADEAMYTIKHGTKSGYIVSETCATGTDITEDESRKAIA